MISEAGLFPVMLAFSILLVFLHRFYKRYMRPCLVKGSRKQMLRGLSLMMFSIFGSVVLRVLGY